MPFQVLNLNWLHGLLAHEAGLVERKEWGLSFCACGWAKTLRFSLSVVFCKCQEEIVTFLAMQKLSDFGYWELFLET